MLSMVARSFTARLVFALLLVGSSTAHAQNATVASALQKNGFSAFLTLARIAGIERPRADVKLTVLAPTDKAVNAWLKRVGLTLDEMKGRPGLAAAVVAYHVLPRIKGNSSLITLAKPRPTKTNPLIGVTVDNIHALKFYLANNSQIVIKDLQGNTAGMVPGKVDIDAGNSIIHGIDKVLLSGDVYLTVDDFLRTHPEFKTMRQLLNQTGLIQQLGLGNRTITVFAPSDAALQAAKPSISKLTTSQLRDVLEYHMIDGEYSLPADMKPGKLYDTLFPGHGIKLSYTQVKNPVKLHQGNNVTSKGSSTESVGLVIRVIPDGAGKAAADDLPQVNLANVYAGKVTIHGINGILMPNLDKEVNASTTSSARPTAKAQQGRKLSQLNPRSTSGGMTVNSLAMTNTQSAIRAAVEGQTSAANAAFVGTYNARSASGCLNCVAGLRGFTPTWRDH